MHNITLAVFLSKLDRHM